MKNSLEKRIGNAARKARVSLGLTQEDVAEKIGVSVEFYSRIERGTALPSLKTFVRMAVVLEVSTDKLLGLTEDEQAQRVLKEFAATQPIDPPDLRRLFRRLRNTDMDKVRFMLLVLNELEKLHSDDNDNSGDSDSDDNSDSDSDDNSDSDSDDSDNSDSDSDDSDDDPTRH